MELLFLIMNSIDFLMFMFGLGLTVTSIIAVSDEKKARWKITIPCAVICLLLSCFPSPEDLWKTRIGLIKYELASAENIVKASETIERIGRKLECKYIGCVEKDK